MPNYRGAFLPGGCRFFTVNLLDRRQSPLGDHIDALRRAFAAKRKKYRSPSQRLSCCRTTCTRFERRRRTTRIFRRAGD
jgi:hypothetical protein